MSASWRNGSSAAAALWLALALLWPAPPAQALPLQSDHARLPAVPAPGPVTIDGQLGETEWDVSGELYVYGIRQKRDFYSVRVAAMWDAQALYLGLKWRDPTPMINKVDPDAAPGEGWMADSFQARFVTDWSQIHFTAWYSSERDKCVVDIRYDGPLNPQGAYQRTGAGPALRTAEGYEMALVRDGDARGYVQELRIPWTLLYRQPAPQAGLKLGFSGEYFWGGPSGTKWPAVMWSDPINQQIKQRVVLYQNPAAWGELELLSAGNLPRAEEERDELLRQGPVPIRLSVPEDATHFTLVVDDAQGRRVRNLVSHAPVSDYVVRLSDGGRAVEVPWDGRADGPWDPERMLFLGDVVPAGRYVAYGVAHRGIGVTYAGDFYNPGSPPWATADGSGGWGFDHSPPGAIAAIPAEHPRVGGYVLIGFAQGEAGFGLIGLDAQGRKRWSWVRLGAVARMLAAHKEHAYFYFVDVGGEHRLARVDPASGQPAAFNNGQPQLTLEAAATGLAGAGDWLVVALAERDKLLVLDAQSGALVREVAVPRPGSLAALPDGRVVGVSENELFWCAPASGELQRFALAGVAQPLAVAADAAGRLYISDAVEQNVKVFAAATAGAALLHTIGEPGGHAPGPWTPQRMNAPTALAVQQLPGAEPHLWVTEVSNLPRRVSVWDARGGLVRDYLGNTFYQGAGGWLSDDDPALGGCSGLLFELDLPAGRYALREILGGSPDPLPDRQPIFTSGMNPLGWVTFANGYHFRSSVSGREVEYYVEGAHLPLVFVRRGGRWWCCAALGHRQMASLFSAEYPPPPSDQAIFSWSDRNQDGFTSPDEVRWHDPGRADVFRSVGWGYRCERDLVWRHSGLEFAPLGFTDDGAPLYDAAQAKVAPGEAGELRGEFSRTKFGYCAHRPKPGHVETLNVIHGLHELVGLTTDGSRRWTYPSYWVSVHGGMSAPMAMPGVVMGVLKQTGLIDGGAHSIVALRGNMGQEFLIRDDGLYLAELFTDQRMAPASLPETADIIGLPINDTTLGGEPFNGWIGRQADGKVRMTFGETDVRVAEVTGLDTVRDLPPATLELDATAVAACQGFVPRAAPPRVTEAVAQAGPLPATDEAAFADPAALVVSVGREEVARVLLRYDEQFLHVACRVFDATVWQNAGAEPRTAFKTGDSLSVFLAPLEGWTEHQLGGQRLLLTSPGGQPAAVRYRPLGPENEPYLFASPVRQVRFASVQLRPELQWQVVPGSADYTLTASLPWADFDVRPSAGLRLRFDIGLTQADDTQGRTARRVQWVDQQTNVVNDTPSEAEFFPARWGVLLLQ